MKLFVVLVLCAFSAVALAEEDDEQTFALVSKIDF
jgi:hypothetical protein